MPKGNRRSQSPYSEEEKHAALALAANVGPTAAANHLGINRRSIYSWMQTFPQLWSDLTAGASDNHRFSKRVAHNLVDLAERYTAAEHDILETIEEGQIKPTDAKEAAALLKAMGSSRQAAVAGARTMSAEPETVEHNINFPQIEAMMERLLGTASPQPALQVENLAKEGESADDTRAGP